MAPTYYGCDYQIVMPKRLTTLQFIERAEIIHKNKYGYEKTSFDKNVRNKVIITCFEHGDFEKSPSIHLRGFGCPKCIINRTSTKELFVKRASVVHNNFYNYSKVKYINQNTNIIIICPKHGEFEATPVNHLHNKTGCPRCKRSKGELLIKEYLDRKAIDYQEQKKFDNCNGQFNSLKFDFYLPFYNLCIEFQGEQHYKPIKGFGGLKTFERCQFHDSLKVFFCKENNIGLLCIPYWDMNEIIKILNDHLI